MNFVESNAANAVVPNEASKRFIEAATGHICDVLSQGKREFRLMPYRVGHCEYLGFDWHDDGGNGVDFTFLIGERKPLPATVDDTNEIWVVDATDALLLIRLIAEAVKGNSVGRV